MALRLLKNISVFFLVECVGFLRKWTLLFNTFRRYNTRLLWFAIIIRGKW